MVHLGRPHGVVDFVQEVGRAGRNNEPVESVVVIGRREVELVQSEDGSHRDWNQEGLKAFLTSQGCRRLELGEFMDGKGVACGDSKGRGCDVCRGGSFDTEQEEGSARRYTGSNGWAEQQRERYAAGGRLWEGRVRQRGEERQKIERGIAAAGLECAACWVHGVGGPSHDMDGCPTLIKAVGGEYGSLRRLIKYEGSYCCYRCSLPGEWCEWYVERKRCRGVDVIVPMVFAGWGLGRTREVLSREVGGESVEELMSWMGKGTKVAGDRATNAVRAVGLILDKVGI